MTDPIASLLGSWSLEINIASILLRLISAVVFAAVKGCVRAA